MRAVAAVGGLLAFLARLINITPEVLAAAVEV
jgi:hypothetical protein